MFVFFAVILVAAVLLIVFTSQRNSVVDSSPKEQDALNTRIYQERLAEIKFGQTDNQHELETELARTLLEESNASNNQYKSLHRATPLLALSVVIVFAFAYLATPQHQFLVDSNAQLAPYWDKADEYLGGDDAVFTSLKNDEIRFLVSAIQLRLANNHNDDQWRRYGELLFRLDEKNLGTLAYDRAYQIAPDKIENQVVHAQNLLTAANGKLNLANQSLFDQILAKEPQNNQVLLMYGFAAYNAGRYAIAIDKWQQLLTLKTPGSKQYNLIASSIQAAKQGLMAKDTTPAVPTPSDMPAPPSAATNGNASIVVRVEVDDAISAKITPNDTLFVFAKAVNGPPMPVAVHKQKVTTFPITITLDDSKRMMDQFRLSNLKDAKVSAFISKSGNVSKKPGDMIGNELNVVVGATGEVTTIRISRVVE